MKLDYIYIGALIAVSGLAGACGNSEAGMRVASKVQPWTVSAGSSPISRIASTSALSTFETSTGDKRAELRIGCQGKSWLVSVLPGMYAEPEGVSVSATISYALDSGDFTSEQAAVVGQFLAFKAGASFIRSILSASSLRFRFTPLSGKTPVETSFDLRGLRPSVIRQLESVCSSLD